MQSLERAAEAHWPGPRQRSNCQGMASATILADYLQGVYFYTILSAIQSA